MPFDITANVNAECRRSNVAGNRLASARGLIAAIIALLLAVALVRADHSTGEWETVEEHWHTIEIAGSIAGWSSTIIRRKEETYKTATQTEMHLRRGDMVVDVVSREHFIERADGTPIRMKRIESTGAGTIQHEWQFGDEQVIHTVQQFGRETARTLDPPEGVWLTPRAVSRYLEQRREAGAKEITYRTISPESGLTPMTVTMTRVGEDEYEFDGRTLPVTVWRTEMDSVPITAIEFVSSDGLALKQEVQLGPSRMVMRRSRGEDIRHWIAQRDRDDAPELLITNLVAPDRPIPRVRDSIRATLRVRASDGSPLNLPQAGAQRIAPDDGNDDESALIVTIDVNNPVSAPNHESRHDAYLESSSLLDFEDEKVRALAAMDAENDVAPMELAEALRRRVHRHIAIKTLDTAFASASETARTRRGDCTEHAVLLAALLRANGIPARVATGLVYADHFAGRDNVFGWHMWTQAWIDGRWWDFDAVLPNQRFHAGYVLISTAALRDDQRYAGLDAFMQLLGNIEIEVIDIAHRRP